MLWEVEGDFTLEARVTGDVRPEPGSSGYRAACLLLWKDDFNFMRFERAYQGSLQAGYHLLHFNQFRDGKEIVTNRLPCDSEEKVIKVRRTGATVFATLGQLPEKIIPWSAPSRLKIGMGTLNIGSRGPLLVGFEDIKLTTYSAP